MERRNSSEGAMVCERLRTMRRRRGGRRCSVRFSLLALRALCAMRLGSKVHLNLRGICCKFVRRVRIG